MNVSTDCYVIADEDGYEETNELVSQSDYNQIEMVEGSTWQQAISDLSESLKNVPTTEIQTLIEALRAGTVNGSSGVITQGCGCFVAIIASHLVDYLPRDSHLSFRLFKEAYGLPIRMMSPFQEWLCLVRPGDTPSNNHIAALFEDELTSIINSRN